MKESQTIGVQSALVTFLADGLWAYIIVLSAYYKIQTGPEPPNVCLYSHLYT